MAILSQDEDGRRGLGGLIRRAARALWWIVTRCSATAGIAAYLIWALLNL